MTELTKFELDCAILAAAVYHEGRGDANWIDADSDGQIKSIQATALALPDHPLGHYSNQETGFEAQAFELDGKVVIAFAGTTPTESADWWNNALLGSGNLSAQLIEAAKFYYKVKAARPAAEIVFTGHSLGGGLASLMAVFFDEQAVTFDAAPFRLAATQEVAAKLRAALIDSDFGAQVASDVSFANYSTSESALILALPYLIPALIGVARISRSAALKLAMAPYPETIDREGNVKAFALYGEALTHGVDGIGSTLLNDLRIRANGAPEIIGINPGGLSSVDLHSQTLLIAIAASPTLAEVIREMPAVIDALFDEKLYAYKADTENTDFIAHLIRVNFDQEAQPSGFLDDFALAVKKIADNANHLNDNAEKALIAQVMDWFYAQSTTPEDSFFSQSGNLLQYTTAQGAGLENAENLAVTYTSKWLASVFNEHGEFGSRQDAAQWNIALESTAVNGSAMNAALSQLFLGNTGDDIFTGGHRDDVLLGGGGNDQLTGGQGNDKLYGGSGTDSYVFDGVFGHDMIIDSDGAGVLKTSSGQNLLPGGTFKKFADNIYGDQATGWKLSRVSLQSDGSSALVLRKDGDNASSITIQNWRNGQFGITLDETMAEQLPDEYIFNGDQRALIRGIEVDQGSIGPTDSEYNTYKWSAATWAEDGTLEGGKVEVNFNDVIYGGNKKDRIYGFGGNDALSGEEADDFISGGDGDDLIGGGAGQDTIEGGAGDDFIISATYLDVPYRKGPGDSWQPPSGKPTVISGSTWGIYDDGDTHKVVGGGSNVMDSDGDLVQGDAGADTITGGLGGDYLDGGEDNDKVTGHGGRDILFGADGEDKLIGDGMNASGTYWFVPGEFHGNDLLDGGKGKDDLWGGGKDDALYGGSEDDRLWGDDETEDGLEGIFHGADSLFGNEGSDQLVGGGADDDLYGGEGNDLLWGDVHDESDLSAPFHGNDLLYGDTGEDQLIGGGANDQLIGGDDNDTLLGDNREAQLAGQHHGQDQLSGGAGYDYLMGGGSNDTLFGGTEDDHLYGDDQDEASLSGAFHGNDHLDGEDGADQLVGGGKNDTLYGGDGDDSLWGDGSRAALAEVHHGQDYLVGGFGQDYLEGGGSNDTLSGGTGDDTLVGDSNHVTVNGAFHGNDYLDGGDGADTLVGFGKDDDLYGGSGEDLLIGDSDPSELGVEFHGDDYLDGGEGNDTLYGTGGDDTLLGGAGNDWLAGADQSYELAATTLQGSDIIFGGYGNDTLIAGSGGSYLSGDADNDRLWGGIGNDTLLGGDGDDLIRSGAGHDIMDGGAGNDTYYVALGTGVKRIKDINDGSINTLVLEGNGFNLGGIRLSLGSLMISDASGTSEIHIEDVDYDDLTGSSPISRIQFSDGQVMSLQEVLNAVSIDIPTTEVADVFNGTSGREVLYALGGDDVIDARGGNDMLDMGDGSDVGRGGDGDDTLYGAAGNDILHGDAGNDLLHGGEDSDALYGGAGNDTLVGAEGIDLLSGGEGDDLYAINEPEDIIIEAAGEGTDQVISTIDYTLGAHLEDLVLQEGSNAIGATGNDLGNKLTGNSVANSLQGGAGDDTLNGMQGADTLDGGAGIDFMVGGAGDDVYRVDDSADVIEEHLNDGNDQVISTSSYALSANIESLTLQGNAAVMGVGNALNNAIQGNDSDNELHGAGGQDTLVGHAGDDHLDGGADADDMAGGGGDDAYLVDHAQDRVVEAVGEGLDTVISSVDYTLGDHVENLTLTGAATTAYGNHLNNTLTGSSQANVLDGVEGADTLIGGFGDDTYVLNGDDDIVIEAADAGADTIVVGRNFAVAEIANIENVTLTGEGNWSATGDDGFNQLIGNSGDNVLNGGGGADVMIGGGGNDTYYVDDFGDDIHEEASAGIDTEIRSIESSYLLSGHVENLTLAGTIYRGNGNELDNVITGNDAANNLLGLAGNDTLIGLAGDDALFGFDGADSLIGGQGNDYYEIDDAGDAIIELADEGDDFVRSTVSWTLGDNLERLAVDGDADLTVTGNALDNGLWGNAGANVMTGGKGNDYLDGGAGNDVYVFNKGDGQDSIDTFDASTATDTLQIGALDSEVLAFQYGTHLFVKIKNSSDQIGFIDYYSASTLVDGQTYDNKIDRITFSNGVTWDQAMIQSVVDRANNNRAPTVSGSIPALTARQGSLFSYTVPVATITDPDSWDSITYSVRMPDGSSVPAWLNFDPVTRVLSGTPAAANLGNLQFILWGTDNYGYAAGTYVNLKVNPPNTAPVLASALPDQNAYEGAAFSYTVASGAFTDPDAGDTLSYSASLADGSALPAWLSFNASTRAFTGTPPAGSIGKVSVRVTARDTGNLSVADVFDVTISVANLTKTGTSAAETLTGGSGNDTLSGAGGNDTLYGQAGNDRLDGGTGSDRLIGGVGDDLYVVDVSGDVIVENAGEGTDLVQSSITYTLAANVENLTLTGTSAINGTGNSGNNLLTGNSAVNSLSGGAGNDTLNGGAGADSLIGGAGDDLYVVDNTSDKTTENAGEGNDTVQSSVTWTLAANLENLTLTGTTAINGTGNTSANVLRGNAAANTLNGGTGIDTLIGGAGNDSYVVDNIGDQIIEYANEGTDSVSSTVTYSLSANVENLTLSGTTAINGTGNDLANSLTGNSAVNTLNGGAGNDTLNGGTGADSLVGGTGDDVYIVDNTSDKVVENANEGTDSVQSRITHTLAANVENLTLTGTSAINGTGNTGHNLLTGNSAVNTLNGGAGNDTLNGGAGADSLIGGAGDDVYIVDNTSDKVVESPNEGTDTVQSSITHTLAANVENLMLTGTTAINGIGNTSANVLTGNAANNTLTGGGGNDTYRGGVGTDTLTASSTTSNDTYIWGRGEGADTLTDAGGADQLSILAGVTAEQVWLRRASNNLEVSVIGTTDRFTITNWYASSANQVESLRLSDNRALSASKVQGLVDAMAAFSPPAQGQTTLPTNYQTSLNTVIATNWV